MWEEIFHNQLYYLLLEILFTHQLTLELDLLKKIIFLISIIHHSKAKSVKLIYKLLLMLELQLQLAQDWYKLVIV